MHGADRVADGIVRIDCAVVSVGAGRFVVAGGCDDHPGRTSRFFASAFEYDAIARAAAGPADGTDGSYSGATLRYTVNVSAAAAAAAAVAAVECW